MSHDSNGVQSLPPISRQTSEVANEIDSEEDQLEGLDIPDIPVGSGAIGD